MIASSVMGGGVFYSSAGGSFNQGVVVVTTDGNDTVSIFGTAANAPLSLFTGAGNDGITVAATAGDQTTLLGPLTIDAGAGTNSLLLNEAFSTSPDSVLVTPTVLYDTSRGFAVSYTATGGSYGFGVQVLTGSGNDVVAVLGTAPGAPTQISTGAGNDVVYVVPGGVVSVDEGSGTNALVVTEAGQLAADSIFVGNGIITTASGGVIYYGATGGSLGFGLTIQGSEGGDLISVGAVTAGTPLFLDGGGGNDTIAFQVQPGSGYSASVNGGPGTNTLVVQDVSGTGVVQDYPSAEGAGAVGAFYPSGLTSSIFYSNFSDLNTGLNVVALDLLFGGLF
jgi:hypothetical protein